ncbi:DUF1467 family protein [Luteithermobacter gelatinilyticus]|uniref:DUF1467 family protein n=1 Tax=Luteithermobacter gelatinilyticus TaxID=2582913 RepID=UPI00143D87F0|nr:DUF1467 family protein [Luteithermobacter gelatinilyticus]|tara:strand:+ start:11779 stop:12027 length:249 start_codon:yes stop_codon:yes gene_type:complete
MSVVSHIVVFTISWWLILFMVLPFGVRNHHESEDQANLPEGIEKGAPVKPQIGRKMLITTGLAFIVWLCFWMVVKYELIQIV